MQCQALPRNIRIGVPSWLLTKLLPILVDRPTHPLTVLPPLVRRVNITESRTGEEAEAEAVLAVLPAGEDIRSGTTLTTMSKTA